MKDPLQEVLAAEAASRARVDAERETLEENLRAARIDAVRLRARNEQRTHAAVEHAERKCVAETVRAIDELDARINRQLDFDRDSAAERIASLVRQRIQRFWPV